MRAATSLLILAGLVAPVAVAQMTPSPTAQANPPNKPRTVDAPSARPVQSTPAAVPSTSPVQPNPAAVPLHPQSDAGATERGLAPVEPGNPRVTNQVQDANSNGRDVQGHVLDPYGQPVGQQPAPASTR